MKILSQTILLSSGFAMMSAATPAFARHDQWGRDRIDAGDVIAGALIIGGIAAIASSGSNRGGTYNDARAYRDYGRGGYDDRAGAYEQGYDSRRAVDQCVNAARQEAGRYGWARVTDVTSINRVRGGYEVKGRLVVEPRGRGNDRGYYYDRYDEGYDKGKFTCIARYGGVEDVRLKGLSNTRYSYRY